MHGDIILKVYTHAIYINEIKYTFEQQNNVCIYRKNAIKKT